MIYKTVSKNAIPIRLTDERWSHITEEHCELAGMKLEVIDTIENPSHIFAGKAGELFAVKKYDNSKYIVVVYREKNDDGFIITAFLTSRTSFFKRRQLIWPN